MAAEHDRQAPAGTATFSAVYYVWWGFQGTISICRGGACPWACVWAICRRLPPVAAPCCLPAPAPAQPHWRFHLCQTWQPIPPPLPTYRQHAAVPGKKVPVPTWILVFLRRGHIDLPGHLRLAHHRAWQSRAPHNFNSTQVLFAGREAGNLAAGVDGTESSPAERGSGRPQRSMPPAPCSPHVHFRLPRPASFRFCV